MLVLQRNQNKGIVIVAGNQRIKIKVIGRGTKLSIDADKEVKVIREELDDERETN